MCIPNSVRHPKHFMIGRVMRPERAPFRKIGFLDNRDCHREIKMWCQQHYKPQATTASS